MTAADRRDRVWRLITRIHRVLCGLITAGRHRHLRKRIEGSRVSVECGACGHTSAGVDPTTGE